MISLPLVAALALSAASAEEERVLDLLDRFFVALERADLNVMRSIVDENADVTTLIPDNDGTVVVNTVTRDGWLAGLDGMEGVIVELYWSPKVEISPIGLSHAWVPYVVEVNGKRSHCGVDAFTMVERPEGWRISDIHFTRDPSGCERLGLEDARGEMRPAALRAKLKS
ncbi:MAG: hypothetical protein AAFR65_04080 [Pseudomonadota bacterium]